MKVSIVIPNYNGEHLLRKNFSHVVKSTLDFGDSSEIIVVDDGSTDNSLEYLKEFILKNKSQNIKILVNEKNMGFSSTVNKGVENAIGELVCLLNTDIEPSSDFLTYLIPHFQNKEVIAVGILDKSEEQGRVVERGRGLGEFKRGFLIHKRGATGKSNTLWASGGSSIWRREAWQKLGGLDEIYNPFYWEDIDLSYRALKSGYKILFESKSTVIHRHGEGAIKKSYSDREIKRIAYRNQIIFVWKNLDLSMLLRHFGWLPYHLLKSLLRADLQFVHGLVDALVRFPKVIKSRSEAKKYFRLWIILKISVLNNNIFSR